MNEISDMSEFAMRICAALDQGTRTLGEKATQRLRAARDTALQRQVVPVAAFAFAGLGQLFGTSWHRHYRGILAFLALLIGTLSASLGTSLWQGVQQADELAAIDSELLSDDVPPSAYTDSGFLKWLQHLSESDDDSSA
jgi:hypothetical protein